MCQWFLTTSSKGRFDPLPSAPSMSGFTMRNHFVYHLETAKLSNDVVYSGPPLGAGKELLSSQLLCQHILPWTKSLTVKLELVPMMSDINDTAYPKQACHENMKS